MPRPKSYGDFYITGKDNVLPVFISTNTVQGRNKYILDLISNYLLYIFINRVLIKIK